MSILSWTYLGAFLVYVALALVVIIRNPGSALNRLAVGFLLCFALWAFEDIFHNYHPLIPLAQARLFGNIGSVGGYSFASVFLLFALALTGRRRYLRHPAVLVPAIGVPLVFIAAQWTGLGGLPYRAGPFGWVLDWSPTFWTVAFPVYYLSVTILALVLINRYRRTLTDPRRRRQATVILAATMASLVLATLSDVVLISLFPDRVPELGGVMGVVWSFGLTLSMTRYGLMPMTMRTAAGDIIATMLDALILVRPDGAIAASNQALSDLLGFRPGELDGAPAAGLFAEPAGFEEAHRRVVNEVPIGRLEFLCRDRNGALVPVALSARVMPKRNGLAPGSVWVLRDVTQLKRAEQKLRESEEKYRTLVEHASEGIVIVQDRVLAYANERAAALVGSTPNEMLGMPFAEYVHPDVRHELARLYERRMSGGATTATYELVVKRRDGSSLPVEVSAGLITFQGRPADMVVLRDISGRRPAVTD